MTARRTPRAMPIAIDVTVSSIVRTAPWRIRLEKSQWRVVPPSNRSLCAIELTSAKTRKSRIAVATHRPGWRTGIALISSGRTWSTVSVAIRPRVRRLTDCRVDLRVRNRALLHVPLREQLLVRPVADQLLERRLGGLRHPVALRERDAVRSVVVRLPGQLELPVRLLDDVRGDGRVGHTDLLPAALDREVGRVLVRIDVDADRRLAGALALRALGSGVVGLRRAALDAHRVAAEIRERVDRRAALRLDVERGAGGEVADEVDDLQALRRDAERGHPDVVLARLEAGDDRVEARVHELP